MARGGSRPGAGRPRGAANVKTQEIVARAHEGGLLPLEVMLDNMRFYHSEAVRVLNDLLDGKAMPDHEPDDTEDEGDSTDPAGEPEGEDKSAQIIEALRTVLTLRKMAGEQAAMAAPYLHPRQGYAGDDGGEGETEIPLSDRLKEYQRRDDLKAAGANIVDLNGKR
jgi:hypothetical protein